MGIKVRVPGWEFKLPFISVRGGGRFKGRKGWRILSVNSDCLSFQRYICEKRERKKKEGERVALAFPPLTIPAILTQFQPNSEAERGSRQVPSAAAPQFLIFQADAAGPGGPRRIRALCGRGPRQRSCSGMRGRSLVPAHPSPGLRVGSPGLRCGPGPASLLGVRAAAPRLSQPRVQVRV